MVYKTGNNLENYPLITAVCLIVLHQFFFCHGDFPVSRNGQSDGNIKEMCIRDRSIEDDLSTYSSHLTNMKIMMKSCNERSLILIDEFGGGTERCV